MSQRFTAIALGATLALAGACGDDDDDGNTDPDAGPAADASVDAAPEPATLDEICNVTDGLFVELFGQAFECQRELFELIIGAVPTEQELSDLCYGALGPYIDDGTVELGDRAAFDACEAYLAGLTCADLSFDAPTPCDGVLVGTVAISGECDSDDQCAGDAYCEGAGPFLGPLPNGVATCGACTAQLADGVDCTDNNECVNGLCAEDVCASYGGVGDACTSSEGCLGSGYCDPGTDQCAAEPTWAVGTPCSTFPFDCGGPGADLFCHPTTQLCVAYLDLADPCDPDAGAAAYCRIFTYESCQDVGGGTFQCVEPTTRSAGQSCGFFTGEKCGTGLICDEGSETCVATAGIDEDCTSNPCEGLLECVGGVCQYGSHTGMCPSS